MPRSISNQPDHVIALNGDVLIVLWHGNGPFAVWDEIQDQDSDEDDKTVTHDKKKPDPARLAHASPVWGRMLSEKWKHSAILRDRLVYIEAFNLDEAAFHAFLNIVHAQPQFVPSTPDLEFLAKIAAIADYYKSDIPSGYFGDNWVGAVPAGMNAYSRDLMLTLWVSFFFGHAALFERCTKIAIESAPGKITSLGLPIPDQVVEDMNVKRIVSIENILDATQGAANILLAAEPKCTPECDAMVLGSLLKQMHDAGIHGPAPESSFGGVRLRSLRSKVQAFECPIGEGLPHTYHRLAPTPYPVVTFDYFANDLASIRQILPPLVPAFHELFGDRQEDWEVEVRGFLLADYRDEVWSPA